MVVASAHAATRLERTSLAERAARAAGVPTRCARVLTPTDLGIDTLPHLSSGKVDYATLTEVATQARDTAEVSPAPGSLRERYAALLGLDAVSPEDSFASLGGDSLSYVEASLHVEDHLGHCVVDAARQAPEAGAEKVREASEAIARLVRS